MKTPKPTPSVPMMRIILEDSKADSMANDPPLSLIPKPMEWEPTMPDQYEGPERRGGQDRRREGGITFDKTINLGHVLTMATMIAAVMASWSLMDKRVVVLEEARHAQRDRDQSQDVASKEKFQEVRDTLIEVRRSLEKISDRIGAAR